jgi:hypothetical protein
MKQNWFAERGGPAPDRTDDELPGQYRPLTLASRACCCPAMPVVTVIMPPSAARRHPVDLLLCGHHYRASRAALRAAGAAVYDRTDTLITPSTSGQSPAPGEPADAGRHQITLGTHGPEPDG